MWQIRRPLSSFARPDGVPDKTQLIARREYESPLLEFERTTFRTPGNIRILLKSPQKRI
jgi:hypothetical protein